MATAHPIDMTEARRIAAAYPPEAKHTPRWEREAYLTDVQQLAWLIRFDPDAATLISNEGATPEDVQSELAICGDQATSHLRVGSVVLLESISIEIPGLETAHVQTDPENADIQFIESNGVRVIEQGWLD